MELHALHLLFSATDLVSQNEANAIHDEVAKYVRGNMAKINVYIRDPYVKRFITEEKITEISFVGTVGGLLGIFLGFSFMSIFEIIYCAFFNTDHVQVKRLGSASDLIFEKVWSTQASTTGAKPQS